jgi:assimilatory nitrate reductase catalytic subunit
MPGGITDTHCPYCALQCGMSLAWNGTGFDVQARDFPTNRGALCRKGWSAADLLAAPDRLTTPLVRARPAERPGPDNPLVPAGWDEALDLVGARMRALQQRHGQDAVGVFGGGGLTNETAYMLGKFARVVLRSRNIDYNGRFCMASAAVAATRAFGVDRGLPFPVTALAAAEVIVLVGANPAETMPPLMQHLDEQRARGGQLMVIDPRRTATAAGATLHLQLTPGTDAALANGLLHIALRDRLVDRDFIAARTEGFPAVERVAAAYWPDRVERITGVPARLIVEAAHLIGEAGSAFVITARGAEQHSHGVDNVLAFINLSLALGKVGRPSSGFGCLTGQGNGQGGREHGQKSDQLPGYRKLADPEHRAAVAAVWGVNAADLPGPGPSALELLENVGAPGGLRALLVMGSNLAVSAPDANASERRLRALDLLVVADLFLSETAALADVVLPVCQWAEHEGTMTNLEGRLLYRARAKAPPPGVRTDLEILKQLALRLDRGHLIEDSPSAAFDELRRASAGGLADYAGIDYQRLRDGEALFWPCPTPDHPGTPRLFQNGDGDGAGAGFATPSGRARFHPVEHHGPAETPDDEFPFYLTTGRLLAHYQSGTQTRRVASLAAAEPEAFVEIHPDLAASHGIAERDLVLVRSRRGQASLRARLSRDIRYDTVFVPFHFAGPGRANNLTSTARDASSLIPEFKVAAVAIARAQTPGSIPQKEPT